MGDCVDRAHYLLAHRTRFADDEARGERVRGMRGAGCVELGPRDLERNLRLARGGGCLGDRGEGLRLFGRVLGPGGFELDELVVRLHDGLDVADGPALLHHLRGCLDLGSGAGMGLLGRREAGAERIALAGNRAHLGRDSYTLEGVDRAASPQRDRRAPR